MKAISSALLQAALVLALQSPIAAEGSSAEAERRLFETLRADHIYPRTECIALQQEDNKQGWIFFAVREKHDAACGGDPQTMPVIDRFRVKAEGSSIEYYDPIEDDYSAYADFKKSHSKK